MAQSLSLKKHNRVILTCKRCRIKKIRCDRKKPCSECTKRGFRCVLDENVNLKKSGDASKSTNREDNTYGEQVSKGLNIFLSPHEKISFFLSSNDAQRVGPLSMDFLEMKDLFLRTLKLRYDSGNVGGEKLWLDENVKGESSRDSDPAGPSLLDTLLKPLKIVTDLDDCLPAFNDIWRMVNFFFLEIYPYMPIVEEDDFKEHLRLHYGSSDEIRSPKMREFLEKKDELFLGLLVIIIRLSYLCHPHSKITGPHTEEQTLKATQIAYICLEHTEKVRKLDLDWLQLGLFLFFYQKMRPEYPRDCNYQSIQNSRLIKVAYDLGLHKNVPNSNTHNLRRKIWLVIVCNDIMDSYTNGIPPFVDPQFAEVHIAKLDAAECFKTIDIETGLAERYVPFLAVFGLLRDTMKMILKVGDNIKVSILVEKIDQLEKLLQENFSYSVPLMMSNKPLHGKGKYNLIRDFKMWISIKTFFMPTYMNLFYHYESKKCGSFSFYYLTKILKIICNEFYPLLFFSLSFNIGEARTLVLTEYFIQLYYRITQILLTVYLRLKYQASQLDVKESEEGDVISESAVGVSFLVTRFIDGISRLSDFHGLAMKLSVKLRSYLLLIEDNSHTFLSDALRSEFTQLELSQVLVITEIFRDLLRDNNGSLEFTIYKDLWQTAT